MCGFTYLEVSMLERAPHTFVFELIAKVVFGYFTIIALNFPHLVCTFLDGWIDSDRLVQRLIRVARSNKSR